MLLQFAPLFLAASILEVASCLTSQSCRSVSFFTKTCWYSSLSFLETCVLKLPRVAMTSESCKSVSFFVTWSTKDNWTRNLNSFTFQHKDKYYEPITDVRVHIATKWPVTLQSFWIDSEKYKLSYMCKEVPVSYSYNDTTIICRERRWWGHHRVGKLAEVATPHWLLLFRTILM